MIPTNTGRDTRWLDETQVRLAGVRYRCRASGISVRRYANYGSSYHSVYVDVSQLYYKNNTKRPVSYKVFIFIDPLRSVSLTCFAVVHALFKSHLCKTRNTLSVMQEPKRYCL